MPRYPFQLKMPKGAKTNSSSTTVIDTKSKPMPYDSSKVYLHMGSALRASENVQMTLYRVSQVISEADEAREIQEAGLAEQLQKIANEIDEFERQMVKFQKGHTQKVAQLASVALGHARTSLGWFQKFLESHSDEDAQAFKPLAEKLSALVTELGAVRKSTVENAVAMEDRFNEKRSSIQKMENVTRPIKRRTWPDPSHDTPVSMPVPIPPQEILDAMKKEIVSKEKKDKLSKEK